MTQQSDRPPLTPNRRALVLGGGGSAGNAWLIGVVAGLLDVGIDVTDADLIIGTSAGATAAAQILSANPTKLYESYLSFVPPPIRKNETKTPDNHLARTDSIIASAKDAADMRRKMGAAAIELASNSDGARQLMWRATVATRLPIQIWPDRTLQITAVDASSGEPVAFTQSSNVDLADAIAASTSSGPAYMINDNYYIDGGYRRNENADLAAGFERVLVLSPLGGRTRHPLEWGMQLAAQVEELRSGGSNVKTILPDNSSLEAFGTNLMNPTVMPGAAQSGYHQGASLAKQLNEFWHSL